MKNNLLYFVILVCAFQKFQAQNDIKNILLTQESVLKSESPSIYSFKKGLYKKAYNQLLNSSKEEIPYYDYFIKTALMFQRDSTLLREEINKGHINLSDFETFFINQNQMSIELVGKTEVDLDKNIFEGIIGNDTIRVLFDTGGKGVSINGRLVEKYNMVRDTTIKREGYVPAYNLRTVSNPTVIPEVKIGNMILRNIPAKFKTNKETTKRTAIYGPEFDLFIGMDIFIGFINYIEFNWVDKKMIFSNEKKTLEEGNDFIVFNSKPISLFKFQEKSYTSLLDTGSGVDLIPKNLYLNHYIDKRAKSYGNFQYNEYTISTEVGNQNIELRAADYKPDFNLTLENEEVPFIIGTNRKFLKLNIKDNVFSIE